MAQPIYQPSEIDHDRLDRLERLERIERQEREERKARDELKDRAAALDIADAADSTAIGSSILQTLVEELGQTHLVGPTGYQSASLRPLLLQLQRLQQTMAPGGVADYVVRARKLLADSREGKNPFEGYTPSVPSGHTLAFGSAEFMDYEAAGYEAAKGAAFVLVAGGLGERLGYSGIKLALPSETTSGRCYLQLYIEHILALGAHSLVLMTSDDTDVPTRALLAEHANFGMGAERLHIVKQGKVPCLADGDAKLAMAASSGGGESGHGAELLTKPHGHGDVHALLHSSGLARSLLDAGCTHLVFIQDTNALVFGGVPAALGLAARHGLVMNTISVPRRAGDASGAIMQLAKQDGRSLTVNVEYNQLDALVRASMDPRGDFNDPATGYSPFPGNTNQILFALAPYVEALALTGGAMPEFVNPKYADASRTSFKSPTRLECMMQDFPWVLPQGSAVGFTCLDVAFYAPVKNSRTDAVKKAQSGQASGGASEGEHAVYAFNANILRHAGCDLPPPAEGTIGGVAVPVGPRVSLSASFRPTVGLAIARLPGKRQIRVTGRSTLMLDGDVTVQALDLDGGLIIRACSGAHVTVRSLRVKNGGWALRELSEAECADGSGLPEVARLRGYEYVRGADVRELTFDTPGEFVVDEK